MEELREKVRANYGPEARIVSAEAVTVGGIKGYLARRHYEVTVRVPGPQRPARSRAGIAALLEEADRAEISPGPASRRDASVPPVSTMSGGFEDLVQDLARSTGSSARAGGGASSAGARGRRAYRAPSPGMYPGDLTVVVGIQEDALRVCTGMARAAASSAEAGTDDGGTRGIFTGGGPAVAGYLSLANRAGAVGARAAGVEGGYPVFVAWAIGSPTDPDGRFEALASLAADQVWLAVDARMKEADTGAWVAAVRGAVEVAGLAVEHSQETGSPQTVDLLGVPVGWVDGVPSSVRKLVR